MSQDTRTDKQKIIDNAGRVNCYICEQVYKRVRGTWRYCNQCGHGFCEGEHGTFEGGRMGICIRCYNL